VWKLLDKLKPDLSCMILLSHSCMYVPKGMWASTQQRSSHPGLQQPSSQEPCYGISLSAQEAMDG
jgi:hypothetical protein